MLLHPERDKQDTTINQFWNRTLKYEPHSNIIKLNHLIKKEIKAASKIY
jgi:hypothetical protein